MRTAALVTGLVVVLASNASANPLNWSGKADVVHGAKHREAPPQGKAITGVSHTLYLDDCMPDGCAVHPGWDDSRENRSTIPQEESHLDAYAWGDAHWNQLVSCVRDTFAPFAIDVVTDDPGTQNHFEVMVGGFDYQVQYDGALGLAPFIPCGGNLDDNVMTFVFASESDDIDILCWAIAQEAAHAWGLDHQLDANDPMTYLYPPYHKEFQDNPVSCGEELASPRDCWCGNPEQNSYQYLMDTFGPAVPVAPTVSIVSPADGAWVTPGFSVTSTAASQMSVTTELAVDGVVADTGTTDTVTFATSPRLEGDHHVAVTITDGLGHTATAAIDVHVMSACEAGAGTCADGFACIGGSCVPDATTTGGLGAACTGDDACITGQCWTVGETSLCSAVCDAERSCPDGFDCVGDGAGTCWPAPPPDAGPCSASRGASPYPFALIGLGLLVALRRRRPSTRPRFARPRSG